MTLQTRIFIFIFFIVSLIRTNGQSIETVVQSGHYGEVTAVCYSPDGKFIVTASSDKTIDEISKVMKIKSYLDDQVPELSYTLIRHKQFPGTFSIGHDFPLVMQ